LPQTLIFFTYLTTISESRLHSVGWYDDKWWWIGRIWEEAAVAWLKSKATVSQPKFEPSTSGIPVYRFASTPNSSAVLV
jgi:hypothetical protein